MHSRINWLRWGNKNTKFFHASTLQRRQRNKNCMLQDNDQNWVRDPTTLREMTSSFFSTLYTTAGYRDYGPILDQCPQVVSTEMNDKLMTLVTNEEVRQATFQLGTTKAPGPDGLNGLFLETH